MSERSVHMRMTNLGEGVCLFEREDGGHRADDHHEDGEQEHGVQHPVLAGDARHPPVTNLRICFIQKCLHCILMLDLPQIFYV